MFSSSYIASAMRVCIALMIPSGLVHGAIVATNFSDTPPGWTTSGSYQVDANGLPPFLGDSEVDWAMGFVANSSTVVDSVTLPLLFEHGQLRVTLTEGLNTILDSTLLVGDPSNPAELHIGQFASRPTIHTGRTYWLQASIETTIGRVYWMNAYPHFSGQGIGLVASRALSPNPAHYNWFIRESEQAAFRLEGTTIPEPATLVLTGIGIITIALRKRSRTSGERR